VGWGDRSKHVRDAGGVRNNPTFTIRTDSLGSVRGLQALLFRRFGCSLGRSHRRSGLGQGVILHLFGFGLGRGDGLLHARGRRHRRDGEEEGDDEREREPREHAGKLRNRFRGGERD